MGTHDDLFRLHPVVLDLVIDEPLVMGHSPFVHTFHHFYGREIVGRIASVNQCPDLHVLSEFHQSGHPVAVRAVPESRRTAHVVGMEMREQHIIDPARGRGETVDIGRNPFRRCFRRIRQNLAHSPYSGTARHVTGIDEHRRSVREHQELRFALSRRNKMDIEEPFLPGRKIRNGSILALCGPKDCKKTEE